MDIPDISPDLREIYRTVWEIKQRSLIDMAADRGEYGVIMLLLCNFVVELVLDITVEIFVLDK